MRVGDVVVNLDLPFFANHGAIGIVERIGFKHHDGIVSKDLVEVEWEPEQSMVSVDGDEGNSFWYPKEYLEVLFNIND